MNNRSCMPTTRKRSLSKRCHIERCKTTRKSIVIYPILLSTKPTFWLVQRDWSKNKNISNVFLKKYTTNKHQNNLPISLHQSKVVKISKSCGLTSLEALKGRKLNDMC